MISGTCDILRLAFTPSQSMAEPTFDLIHYDVWGPFSPCTTQGFHYFLTIVDDASRFVWTFLMKHKSDVNDILTQFLHSLVRK